MEYREIPNKNSFCYPFAYIPCDSVNLCQLDFTGCSDIWSNITLGVSVNLFLDEIHIWTSRLPKARCSPGVGGSYPISSRPEQNEKAYLLLRISSCLTNFELDHHIFFWLQNWTEILALPESHISLPSNQNCITGSPQALGVKLELHHWLSWVSSLPNPEDLGTFRLP